MSTFAEWAESKQLKGVEYLAAQAAWNTALDEAAKLCTVEVDRSAGYDGQWEGYGGFKGEKTGSECAAIVLGLRSV